MTPIVDGDPRNTSKFSLVFSEWPEGSGVATLFGVVIGATTVDGIKLENHLRNRPDGTTQLHSDYWFTQDSEDAEGHVIKAGQLNVNSDNSFPPGPTIADKTPTAFDA